MVITSSSSTDSIDLYGVIFEKHNVTKAEFDSTVSAYTRRSDLFKEIYDEVLLKINVMVDETKTDARALDEDEMETE